MRVRKGGRGVRCGLEEENVGGEVRVGRGGQEAATAYVVPGQRPDFDALARTVETAEDIQRQADRVSNIS